MGLVCHGVQPTDDPTDADFTVSWGARNRPGSNKPWLMLEAGYINGHSGDYVRDRLRFVSTSWNAPHGCASPAPSGCPPDRWEKLGIELRPWKRSRMRALILMQARGDAFSPPRALMERAAVQVNRYYVYSDVREHPVQNDVPPLASILSNYDLAVTYSSNAAVETVIAGIPTIALSDISIAYPVTSHDVLAPVYIGDREQWAYNLAYRQWTHDELADGTAWETLRHGIGPDHAD